MTPFGGVSISDLDLGRPFFVSIADGLRRNLVDRREFLVAGTAPLILPLINPPKTKLESILELEHIQKVRDFLKKNNVADIKLIVRGNFVHWYESGGILISIAECPKDLIADDPNWIYSETVVSFQNFSKDSYLSLLDNGEYLNDVISYFDELAIAGGRIQ